MYICLLHVRYHTPILFTWIAALSHREGACVKYESLGQITSCWVGQDKQGRYNMEESWQEAQSNPRRGQNAHIREVLQEIALKYVCNIHGYIVTINMKRKEVSHLNNSLIALDYYRCSLHNSLFMLNDFFAACIIHSRAWCLFFCKLKIMSLFLNQAPLRTETFAKGYPQKQKH